MKLCIPKFFLLWRHSFQLKKKIQKEKKSSLLFYWKKSLLFQIKLKMWLPYLSSGVICIPPAPPCEALCSFLVCWGAIFPASVCPLNHARFPNSRPTSRKGCLLSLLVLYLLCRCCLDFLAKREKKKSFSTTRIFDLSEIVIIIKFQKVWILWLKQSRNGYIHAYVKWLFSKVWKVWISGGVAFVMFCDNRPPRVCASSTKFWVWILVGLRAHQHNAGHIAPKKYLKV